jgi:hypothetical protein
MKLLTGLTLTTFAVIALPIAMAYGATIPVDGDSWSEYANWVEAYYDGWNPECGLTLQTITPQTAEDCMVGAGSVGFELQSGTWNKDFTYERPEWSSGGLSMDRLIALHFWYKTTWEAAAPLYNVRVYVEPTEIEELDGITAKRLSWQIPTSLAWTEFQGSFDDAVWECYSEAVWSPCADTATPTAVLKLEWEYFVIFGPGAGHRTLIDGLHFVDDTTSSVTEQGAALTVSLRNHPNPFQHETAIRFELREPRPAKLVIYDVLGRRVRAFRSVSASDGAHEIRWDGRDDRGRLLPTGVYFSVVAVGEQSLTRRIVLIR